MKKSHQVVFSLNTFKQTQKKPTTLLDMVWVENGPFQEVGVDQMSCKFPFNLMTPFYRQEENISHECTLLTEKENKACGREKGTRTHEGVE